MVIRYNVKAIYTPTSGIKNISKQTVKHLTAENKQFLRELGLKLKSNNEYIKRGRKGFVR